MRLSSIEILEIRERQKLEWPIDTIEGDIRLIKKVSFRWVPR